MTELIDLEARGWRNGPPDQYGALSTWVDDVCDAMRRLMGGT